MKVLSVLVAGIILILGTGKVYAAQYELKVEGIKCVKCISKIEGSLKNLEGVNEVKANLEGEVYVDVDSKKVTFQDLSNAIEDIDAGKFKVKEITNKVHIEGMTCGACVRRVKNALTKLGVKEAKVSLKDKQATVTYDPEEVTISEMIDAVSRAGFKASLPR